MENKPMSVVMAEVKNGIVSILNQSGLPIYIGEMLLKEILNDVSNISNQVREREYQEYIQNEQKENIVKLKKREERADK